MIGIGFFGIFGFAAIAIVPMPILVLAATFRFIGV